MDFGRAMRVLKGMRSRVSRPIGRGGRKGSLKETGLTGGRTASRLAADQVTISLSSLVEGENGTVGTAQGGKGSKRKTSAR